jgi:hypothetical protein
LDNAQVNRIAGEVEEIFSIIKQHHSVIISETNTVIDGQEFAFYIDDLKPPALYASGMEGNLVVDQIVKTLREDKTLLKEIEDKSNE